MKKNISVLWSQVLVPSFQANVQMLLSVLLLSLTIGLTTSCSQPGQPSQIEKSNGGAVDTEDAQGLVGGKVVTAISDNYAASLVKLDTEFISEGVFSSNSGIAN